MKTPAPLALLLPAMLCLAAACSSSDKPPVDSTIDLAPTDSKEPPLEMMADGHEAAVGDSTADSAPPDAGLPTKRSLGWFKALGSTRYDRGRAVAVDSEGNVYFTGSFAGPMDFGDGVVTPKEQDAFITSYDATGAFRWMKSFGGDESDTGRGVAVDGADNVYVVGEFRLSADFGDGPKTSKGERDIFVASFDADGTFRWAKTFGDTPDEEGTAIAVTADGNAHIAGALRGPVTIGADDLTSQGTNALLFALDPNGVPRWAKSIGGSGSDIARAVAVDSQGFVSLGGEFSSSVDFGGGVVEVKNQADAFVARYTSSGSYSWAKGFGGDGWDGVRGMAVDGAGNLFVVGTFYGSIDFGGGPHAVVASSDVFAASLDSQGAFRWSGSFGGYAADQGRAITASVDGIAHVAGEFRDLVDFGGETVAANGDKGDIFVTSMAPLGDHLFSAGYGGVATDFCYGIAIAPDGALYITGAFDDSVDFGDGAKASQGSSDIYLVKLVVE